MRIITKRNMSIVIAIIFSFAEPAHAGYLSSVSSALKKVDTKKLKSWAEKGQSFLGSVGGGDGGSQEGEEGKGAACPAICPAEQASLNQEISGVESLVKSDENALSNTGAKYVDTQSATASPTKQSLNAASYKSKAQGLLNKVNSNKGALKGLWGKLKAQTGK